MFKSLKAYLKIKVFLKKFQLNLKVFAWKFEERNERMFEKFQFDWYKFVNVEKIKL